MFILKNRFKIKIKNFKLSNLILSCLKLFKILNILILKRMILNIILQG